MKKYNLIIIREFFKKFGFTLLSKEYINDSQKLILQDSDGFIYITSFNTFKAGHIPDKFNISNPYTLQNIKLWCKLENKPFELISEIYKGAGNANKLQWKCLKEECGEIFEAPWAQIYRGSNCLYCINKKVGSKNNLTITHPELIKEWHPDNIIKPIEVTHGTLRKVIWICSKCKNVWKSQINSRTSNDTGCPKCATSKLEKAIEEFLINNNIEYVTQFRFKDCRNKKPLPYDFYLPKLNICIEADGIQHIKAYKFFGGEEKFLRTKKHDQIKTDYCLSNDILLIRIPYSKLKNIPEILTELLLDGNKITC